jgi:predicted nuclease of predicted toxin-antitoxin system
MKLLFDHNLSPSLIQRLHDLYPDSDHLFRLNLDQVPDSQVWDFAKQAGFMIVTKDADFSDLCLIRGFPPKIVWIRRGNCKTSDIEFILRQHYQDIEALNADESAGVITLF